MHVDGSIFSPASNYRFCFLHSSSCMCVAFSFSDSHKLISLLYCIVCRLLTMGTHLYTHVRCKESPKSAEIEDI